MKKTFRASVGLLEADRRNLAGGGMRIWETGLRGCLISALACVAAACASAPEAPARTVDATQSPFEMTLKPELGPDGEVEAIHVDAVLNGGLREGEDALKLMAPIVYVNVTGIADRIQNLSVTDAAGPVSFTTEDEAAVPGGFPYFRHWTATRDVSFPVSISYRALVQPEGSLNGPAFGIRPSAGGVSGSGAGFMLLPSNAASPRSTLQWDLAAFEPGAVGVTTFGEGRVLVEGAPTALMQGWLMAGPAGQYPPADEESHFRAYWLGAFPYDEAGEMEHARHLYDFFADFFGYLDPAPDYRVFLRQLDTPPFGGATALANSFMMSRGPAEPEEIGQPSPRQTVAHEMIHMWVGGLSGEHIRTNWFSEGLTTYYEFTLPFRAGELSIEDYIEGLNDLSERYYSNPGRTLSAIDIGRVGFGDGSVRHVPYNRGAHYFADLDARIRAASSGRRTLDAFMREVFEAREAGTVELTIEAWSDLVTEEIGGDEYSRVLEFHIDGGIVFPAENAFGACVRGIRETVGQGEEAYETMRWVRVPEVLPEACFRPAVAD